VLGTGSRGNAVVVEAGGAALLVDAGFGPRALLRRAEVVGVDLTRLAGIVLTHEHGDHARGAAVLAARLGCALYASPGTLAALGRTGEGIPLPPLGQSLTIGPFRVDAARTAHDAREPVAVLVTEAAGRRVGIAWDLGRPTAGVRHLLRGAHALVLEANHDEVMLQTGPYPASVRQRIGGSTGHLSNRLAAELAGDLWWPRLEVVVLAHVSEQCNDADVARRTVGQALRRRGFRGRLYVAGQRDPLPAISLQAPDQLALALAPAPAPASGPAPGEPPSLPRPAPAGGPTPRSSPPLPAPIPGSSA
jgi:phosphoribosyl 1,2-cyclic phosphodiesterase